MFYCLVIGAIKVLHWIVRTCVHVHKCRPSMGMCVSWWDREKEGREIEIVCVKEDQKKRQRRADYANSKQADREEYPVSSFVSLYLYISRRHKQVCWIPETECWSPWLFLIWQNDSVYGRTVWLALSYSQHMAHSVRWWQNGRNANGRRCVLCDSLGGFSRVVICAF